MTLGEAILDLQRQAHARGLAGLDDIETFPCEDGRTWLIMAYYSLDRPLTASFTLPTYDEDDEELIERIRAKFASSATARRCTELI